MNTWINAFLALFAILNPLGNLPIFAGMARSLDPVTRRRLFNVATVAGLVTLSVLTLCGQWIMETVFHITMAEFKIAGGVMLIVISVRNLVLSSDPRAKEPRGEEVLQMGVVPIAIPMLVGPGSVVTAILILNRDGPLVAYTSIVSVFALTWIILQSSSLLHRIVGPLGSLALSRILQIFICAIGVHFLAMGLKSVFGMEQGL